MQMGNLGAALLILTRLCYGNKNIYKSVWVFLAVFYNFNNIKCVTLIQSIFLFGKPVEKCFQSNKY